MSTGGVSRVARRTAAGLVLVVLLLMALFVLAYWLVREPGRIDPEVFRMVHINLEHSVPSWFNSALLLGVAFLALLGWWTASDVSQRRAFAVIGLGATYLSLDEGAGLHEVLPRLLGVGLTSLSFSWVGAGLVVGAVGCAVLIVVGRGLPRELRRPLVIGLAAYGIGALGGRVPQWLP